VLDSFRVLAGGLDHPEGVAWDPVSGRVYAGGEAGQIYAITLDGAVETVAVTGGFVLGLAVDGRGLVYACDVGRRAVLCIDPATGNVRPFASGDRTRTMAAPNWLAFDADGRLYVTESGDWGKRNGRVWRVDPDGDCAVWTTAADRLPNGYCLNAEGDALFVMETNVPGLTRIPIRRDRRAGRAERWLELPGTVPDGVALAADGSLLVACYRPDGILRVCPDRSVETAVIDPDAQILGAPANVAFVGPDLDRVVTSNLGRWHVAIGDVGLRGAPLPRPVVT
jgi:sugar lactone lactonase YvrE